MHNSTDSREIRLKDIKSMAVAIVAVLAMPVSVWLMRPGPLRAESAPELASLARTQLSSVIIDEIRWKVKPYDTTPGDIKHRWQTLQQDLSDEGVETNEIDGVMDTALPLLEGKNWPVGIVRGWVRSEPAWIVITGWDSGPASKAYICPPSSADLKRDREEGITAHTRVLVIRAEAPYTLLSG